MCQFNGQDYLVGILSCSAGCKEKKRIENIGKSKSLYSSCAGRCLLSSRFFLVLPTGPKSKKSGDVFFTWENQLCLGLKISM